MSYDVRAATTAADREAVFRGRHRVYVDEMGAMSPRVDGMIRDAVDDAAGTLNLVICDETGRIVGGARFMADEGRGTTADAYYDFSPHLPANAQRGAGSMLWVLEEARGVPGLVPRLMAAGHAWAAERGLTHLLATVNPPVAPRFARAGYVPVGEPFTHQPSNLPVQPMLLELRRVVGEG
jgi:N-acyl-L-homoserine lactone synthetase